MRKIVFKILLFLFVFSYPCFSYASSWITINEIKENIKILQEKEKEIFKSDSDLNSISQIQYFLRSDLTKEELEKVNKIISDYNLAKNSYWKDYNLNDAFIKYKKETYKKLSTYVKSEKLQDFLNYIKDSVDVMKQDSFIKTEITKNQELLNTKLTTIQEKIEKNKQEIQNNIKESIRIKVDEKIKVINDNESFKKLDLDKKKYIIKKIIEHAENKKNNQLLSSSWTLVSQIDLYDIVIEKLNEFLLNLK